MRISVFGILAGVLSFVNAIELDLDNTESILNASKVMVKHILNIFPTEGTPPRTSSGETPGLLPSSYHYWNSAIAHSTLLRYWAAAGDDSIAPFIRTGILFQAGQYKNFMPPNQSLDEGNDDQGQWGLAAMTAAELGFPIAADDHSTNATWLELAQTVFELVVRRWDDSSCGGGLKWQIYNFTDAYNYKTSVSNGVFAELAARLYRFTGNETYEHWAQRSVEWSKSVGIIDENYSIFDGTYDTTNCTSIDHTLWTYNSAVYLKAAAYISNTTDSNSATGKDWNEFAKSLFYQATGWFIDPGSYVIYEASCESTTDSECNVDMQSFKSDFVRGLADTSQLLQGEDYRVIQASIKTILRASAKAAAASCTEKCGFAWREKGNDGINGVGSYLNALDVFLANLPARPIHRANNAATEQPPTSTAVEGATAAASNEAATNPETPRKTGSASSCAASPILALCGVLAVMALL